ncbi:MAG TPA: class I SAM-dependent methyltransferase [Pyrinomonadaceae bacterium]|jgi:2-polyprenyl-3-methyl-5-hydroxy-6-metoxy-1,4-benzoquinol methylase|nr:class I SAM-dependent methyltransferase [Pyrinomonadaceae bacterium]
MAEDKALTAGKFSAIARGWSEREYGDIDGFMRRRAAWVREWGTRLRPGDRILELGCGDGTLSCVLASEGFDVTGVDISQGMVEEARRRAARESSPARFEVADSDLLKTEEPFDAVVSFMGAFFTYTENPSEFLARVAPRVRKKIIVDWNFRSPCTFEEAARALETAGLHRIEWRPWLVPHTTRAASRPGLRGRLEERPNLSLLLLTLKRWHYTIHFKGEKADAETRDDNDGAEKLDGHALPGGLLQRTLIKLGQTTR